MIQDRDEVIKFFIDLKKKISAITDPVERRKAIHCGLNQYTLSEWCDIGRILRTANLI
jgi:hypothetical protein